MLVYKNTTDLCVFSLNHATSLNSLIRSYKTTFFLKSSGSYLWIYSTLIVIFYFLYILKFIICDHSAKNICPFCPLIEYFIYSSSVVIYIYIYIPRLSLVFSEDISKIHSMLIYIIHESELIYFYCWMLFHSIDVSQVVYSLVYWVKSLCIWLGCVLSEGAVLL